tara:strand:- start:1014 stop:1610 length:597 start_codon:yes stop_codon:yes gene_type:complete
MIVGLTGGIGSGKSAAGNFFIELGIDLIDADMISKNILDDNLQARKSFVETFGEGYLNENNKINRSLLRKDIFKDNNKKEQLELIIHPIVQEEILRFISKSNSIYKIIMVPLIFETNSKDFYDKIILIDCEENYQIERASQRDKKTKEDIVNIIKNQATREQRQSIADEIILNNSTLEDLKSQVIKVHQKLLGININE